MNGKKRVNLPEHQTIRDQTLEKQLAPALALNVNNARAIARAIACVVEYEKEMKDMRAMIAPGLEAYIKQGRDAAAMMADLVEAHQYLQKLTKPMREMQAMIAGAAETHQYLQKQANLMRDTYAMVAGAVETHQYLQKQGTLGFPNIIRRGLSVNPPSLPEPKQNSIPSPELVPSKLNDKAADKKIFIGHGRSDCWKELRDFVSTDLGLSYDEFNLVPTAGLATAERLQQMTSQADMAFLIMTAENEYADGTLHARENVVHEIGLFQGTLGFKKAIILLENGCKEFSNIHGLGQIRFSKGNIKAAFENIREVLKREGIIE